MAADASLIKGAAAMAQAEVAKETGVISGIIKGTGTVMAEWAKLKAEDEKLDKELMKWSQGLQAKIITDDPDLRDAATAARDKIGEIAVNTKLDRDDQRKQILEITDNFVITGGQYARKKAALKDLHDQNRKVGNNVSKAYDTWTGAEIVKQLKEGTAEELKDSDGNAIGWKFIIPGRKKGDEATTLEVSYDGLVDYAKKPSDRAAITAFQTLVTSKNKQTEIGGEANSITSVNDSFNIAQKREILSNMEETVYVPGMTDADVETSFKQHVTNNIRAEKETTQGSWSREQQSKGIAALKEKLTHYKNVKVTQPKAPGGKRKITGLPVGWETMVMTQEGVSWPVLAAPNQSMIRLKGDESSIELQNKMIQFYHGTEAYHLKFVLPIITNDPPVYP